MPDTTFSLLAIDRQKWVNIFPKGWLGKNIAGTSLVVQWLGLHASTAGNGSSIPGQGLRSCKLHGMAKTWKKKKKKSVAAPFITTLKSGSSDAWSSPSQSVQSLSRVQLFGTPWTAAPQASLSITSSWSLLKLMSIKSVMPSSHLILCHPLLLLPSIFPNIRGFSNESVLHIRWPQYWSFIFSISPSNDYSGLISFRMDWLDLLAVQGTLKSLLQHHSSDTQLLGCVSMILTNSMDTETGVDLSSKTGHERSQTRTSTFWMSPVWTVWSRLRSRIPAVRSQAGSQAVLVGAWWNGRGTKRFLGMKALPRLYLELDRRVWLSPCPCLREVYQGSLVRDHMDAHMKMLAAVFSTAEEKWAQPEGPLIKRRCK